MIYPADWQIGYNLAIAGLILSALQIRRRAPFHERLLVLRATMTRLSPRGAKWPHRLGFRDRLGELAAAFDRLAETLREKESPSSDSNGDVGNPAEWLPAIAHFNRALRACPDRPSIERVLVETVERAFPGCVVVLCLDSENMLPHETNRFYRPKADAFNKREWKSYATFPLRACGEELGALSVYGREHPGLSALEIDFVSVLTDQAALAIEKFQIVRHTLEQSAGSRGGAGGVADCSGTKADFLTILSHEFRTPLNLIMGYTEFMKEELIGKITAEQRKCLGRVMKASDDLLFLVTNMLQAGNIESGCIEVNRDKVRLTDLLRKIQSESLRPEEKNLDFIWDIREDLPVVRTDADKLRHVLRHLIGNAVKFTERGHVRLSARSFAGNVEITVSDTGLGIAENVLPQLFEKYRQLDSSIAWAYEGVGLGLFIAKRLTEMLGGELKVVSRPGIGSTFTVVLPLCT
jgi:signal transduction histidine kinase